jgi:hypothetical protein
MDSAPGFSFGFSLFDRTVARPRPAWATVLLVLLLCLPTLAVVVNRGLANVFASTHARSLFTAPAVIAYIVIIAPVLSRMQPYVIRSLRPVILLDDQQLARVVLHSAAIPPLYEAIAIGIGLLLGVFLIGGVPGPGLHWTIYIEIANDYAMCGLLGWLGLISIASTRVVRQVLRLPLAIDPLDITPFEAIGQQSLVIALAFVGGNILGYFLGSYGASALGDPRFWVLFGPLFLLPLAVFFLNMVPTQRVLSKARKRELADVVEELNIASRRLLQCRKAGEPTGNLAQEVNALATFEQRLRDARSWPYNTAILRALVFSILVQVASVLARRMMESYVR